MTTALEDAKAVSLSAQKTADAAAALVVKLAGPTVPPVTPIVSPATATLKAGQTQQFTASGAGSAVVAWGLSGPGTISQAGLYTAPAAVPAATTATVNAKVAGAVVPGIATVTLLADVVIQPPPVPGPIPAIEERALTPSKLIVPDLHKRDSTSYQRYQECEVITADIAPVGFRVMNAGALRPFSASYTLLVDGVEHETINVPAGAKHATFMLRSSELSHGDHMLDIVGSPGETCIPVWPIVVRPDGVAPLTMPATLGSHDVNHRHTMARTQWTRVPCRRTPIAYPVVPREYPAVTQADNRKTLFMTQLVPRCGGDLYDPRRTAGMWNTCNTQNYPTYPTLQRFPGTAMYDGPRGDGSITSPTHMMLGISGDSIYVCEAQRVARVSPDGRVTTLFGIRSRTPAARSAAMASSGPVPESDYDWVGDWSGIPSDRWGIWETWGAAWVPSSIRSDPTAEKIPNDAQPGHPLQFPHLGLGAKMLVADSQHNRLLGAQFRKDRHGDPPVMSEFVTGLADPWDVVIPDDGSGIAYVSERKANRISMWDEKTGAPLGVLVQGPADLSYADLNQNRKAVRFKPLNNVMGFKDGKPYIAQVGIRGCSCVLPEGLAAQGDWIYFGSLAMQQIKRVHKTTREVQVMVDLPDSVVSYTGANYVKIALSDGTFGPLGTMFVQMWTSNNLSGLPAAFLPDGTQWGYIGNGGNGPGMTWSGFEYGSACAVGRGRLIFGSSIRGLSVVGKATAADKTYDWDHFYKPAEDAWYRRGLHMLYGEGFSPYGFPLPWGVDPMVDVFLEMHGHKQEPHP